MKGLKNAIVEQIKTIFDPEIPVNIYDLGLIYEVNVDEKGQVEVIMTLTSPACPVAGSLPGEGEEVVMNVDGVEDAVVELVFDPPWNKDMMSEEAKFELGFD